MIALRWVLKNWPWSPAPGLALVACIVSLAATRPAWPNAAPVDTLTGSRVPSPPSAPVDTLTGSRHASLAPAGWGPIPEPSDSITALLKNPGMPAWEQAVVWPYRVVTFPARLAVDGLGAGVIFLDDHRVIRRIQKLLAPPISPFGFDAQVELGGTGGPGAGLTFYHNNFPGRGNRFRIGFESSIYGSRTAHAGVQVGRLESGAGYRLRPGARFFGVGPGARAADESFYTQETSWGGVAGRLPLPGRAGLSGTAIYSTCGARGPNARNEPALPEVFGGGRGRPAGYGRSSDGVSLGLELQTAPVEETGRSENGTIGTARAVYFARTDGESPDFWTYRGEIQQFVPLWFSQRALALRGVLTWIDPAGPAAVPFQRLLTNDSPDLFRGYEDLRWRDRGLVLFTAEYRWPVWAPRDGKGPGVDAYLLTDVGQVFGAFSEISGRHLTTSGGGGLRLVASRGFVARVEAAAGGEELQIRLAASQVFQAGGNRLFRGRCPVPER